MKVKLQSVTPYKVMNVKECLDALGWTYDDDGENYNNIACPCGGEMKFRGFVGTEVVECAKCGKHMVDLFSPIPVSNSSCAVLNPKDYEMDENRHWIALDDAGGILVEQEASNGQDS